MKNALQIKSNERMRVPFEVKDIDDSDPDFFIFEGLASTFGNIDLVDDIVARGAFVESLKETIPVIMWQHKQDEPIGMPAEIFESKEGLYVKARLPKADTFVMGRVIPQIKIGSIRWMSIGYVTIESDMEGSIRILKKLSLKEISLVTFPANPMAKVTGFKSEAPFYDVEAVKKISSQREFEGILRESGLFSKAASVILANNFVIQGEPDDQEEAKLAIAELCKKMEHSEAETILNSLNRKLEN